MHRVAILLGSNIEPETNLPAAVKAIASLGEIVSVSQVWQTAPVGFLDQADFCNAAVLLLTSLQREELRISLRAIEQELGRVRDPGNKNAPRTIDLDVCLVEGVDAWCDPEVWERVFVAMPMAELLPEHQRKDSQERLAEAVDRLRTRDGERLRLQLRKDLPLV